MLYDDDNFAGNVDDGDVDDATQLYNIESIINHHHLRVHDTFVPVCNHGKC